MGEILAERGQIISEFTRRAQKLVKQHLWSPNYYRSLTHVRIAEQSTCCYSPACIDHYWLENTG